MAVLAQHEHSCVDGIRDIRWIASVRVRIGDFHLDREQGAEGRHMAGLIAWTFGTGCFPCRVCRIRNAVSLSLLKANKPAAGTAGE
jgi:hypothetical protein